MSDRARALLQEALTLPPDERAEVAAELMASLDDSGGDPAAVQTAWEGNRKARPASPGWWIRWRAMGRRARKSGTTSHWD